MNKHFDAFWEELVRKHRRKNGFAPSADELEAEAGIANDEPLTEDEIESIVTEVTAGDERETKVNT